jgi:hypothetical protein
MKGLTTKDHFEVAVECGVCAFIDAGRCGLHLVLGTVSLTADGLAYAAKGTRKAAASLKRTEHKLESPVLKAKTAASIVNAKDKAGRFFSSLNPKNWRSHAQKAQTA